MATSAISEHYAVGDPMYINMALAMSFLVGCFQFGLGLLQAGVVATFLSHPVVLGFTNVAAILIGSSQLKHVFRIKVVGGQIWDVFYDVGRQIPDTHWPTFGLAVGCMVILVFMKKWKQSTWRGNKVAKMVPGALVVVVVGTLVGWLAGENSGLKKVGAVPGGLPTATFAPAYVSGGELKALVLPALMASLIGYMESVSVASKYSIANNYEINPNQVTLFLHANVL
jgi:SulP family sulfate permease